MACDFLVSVMVTFRLVYVFVNCGLKVMRS